MNDQIRPFRIEVPQADVDDLRDRLGRVRWPDRLDGTDPSDRSRGIPDGELAEVLEHWRSSYDWRAHEAALNELPQFTTTIDDQPIHFAHVRSGRTDAVPLLLLHGYPSSFAEFAGIVDDLVEPADGPAFHVVVPSLPGFGFSTPLASAGWTMGRIARAFVELMARLGYEQYGVHGGDIGAGVAGMIAGYDEAHVTGVHIVTDPMTAANTATFIPGMADRLDVDDPTDALILERMDAFTNDGSGYLAIQQTRPRTIGYALADSPVFQLAWIAEKLHEWTEVEIDRDLLLTHVGIYWFNRAGGGAAHVLYDQAHSADWGTPANVPHGFSVFGADDTVRKLVPAPEGAFWSEHQRGLHFPAMEVPGEVASDIRAFFGGLGR
ncbi:MULTISPECIES: epoxide hydrolase family protein [unclassified Nocardioides]|uniref:epoxide hydrolase family protein n=1 Tax=unclassified Nocardioides TaxID=2615069 RepID=UPI00361D17CC